MASQQSLLNQSIVDLYMTLKDKIKEYSNQEDAKSISPEERDEELARLKNFDNLVLVDYIKSSLDILLGLKIEAANKKEAQNDRVLSSSRGGDQ